MDTDRVVSLIFIVVLLLVGGSYLLFRHTMNKVQYVEHLKIYWITRNNAEDDTPRVTWAFMRQVERPYWYGDGIQFKFRRWTFQVGVLKGKSKNLLEQLGGRELDIPPSSIRKGEFE